VALRAKNKLTARKLLAGGSSKDGAQVYGIVRNTTGEGAEWQLYAIDVKTGAEKMLAPLDLPASTDGVAGFCILTATPSSRPSPSGRCDRCAFAFGRVLQYISWSRSHREGGGSLPLRNETHRTKTGITHILKLAKRPDAQRSYPTRPHPDRQATSKGCRECVSGFMTVARKIGDLECISIQRLGSSSSRDEQIRVAGRQAGDLSANAIQRAEPLLFPGRAVAGVHIG